MIGRLQLALLIAELVLAAGAAAWFARAGWLPAPLAVFVGALMPLGMHATVLLGHFTLAWLERGERPADHPCGLLAGLRAWVGAYLREVPDSVRTMSFAQPLLGRRPFAPVRRLADGEPARLPVLLIHGYFCNRALWRPMAARLAARGHEIDAIDLEPPFASIDDYAPAIAAAVDALRARTGASRVALVAHSMGGLAARAYLRACGDDAVAIVVTLGSPHRGTVHARFGQGTNARQMRRDSQWLRELAAGEPPSRLAKFVTVFSWQDNIVAPQGAQTLPGARAVAFTGMGHMTLVYDARVAGAVVDAIDAADARRARAHGGEVPAPG